MVIFIGASGEAPPPPVTSTYGVVYDGVNDYLTEALPYTGAAASKTFLFSGFFKPAPISDMLILGFGNSNNYMFRGNASPGNFIIQFSNSAGTAILQMTVNSALPSNVYSHIAIAVDLANSANRAVMVNRAAASVSWATYTNDNIDFARSSGSVQLGNGATSTSTTKYSGEMQNVYFAPGQWIDITNTTNLNKLVATDGTPVSVGATGSLLTGTAPAFYFEGNASNFGTNKGNGGTFTQSGLFENGTTAIVV